MKREGELVLTIDADGKATVQIVNNDSPGHGELLKPLERALSDGNLELVESHRHDHAHGHSHDHTHQHGGHGHGHGE